MNGVTIGAVAWLLVAPVLLLGLAPLLDGLGRRVRARLTARAGPPLAQGYLDLAKLAGKESLAGAGGGPLATWAPAVALGAAVAAGVLLPAGGRAPLGFAGDAIVLVYLLALSSVALAVAGAASGSPYGFAGASREMVLLLSLEPVVAGALCVLAMTAGTFRLAEMTAWHAAHGVTVSSALVAVALVLALVAYMSRLPFDLAEAEQELTGGVLVELGGRALALCRWALFVRWLVVAWLVAEVVWPVRAAPWLAVPLAAVKALALFGVAAVAETVFARLKLREARRFLGQVAALVALAAAFALIGA